MGKVGGKIGVSRGKVGAYACVSMYVSVCCVCVFAGMSVCGYECMRVVRAGSKVGVRTKRTHVYVCVCVFAYDVYDVT